MKYATFTPEIFLRGELRMLEQEHFARSNGFSGFHTTDAWGKPKSGTVEELEAEINRVKRLLDAHSQADGTRRK